MYYQTASTQGHHPFVSGNDTSGPCFSAYGSCENAVRMTTNIVLTLAEIASVSTAGSCRSNRPDLILEWGERCEQIADLWKRLLIMQEGRPK
jgi:hypothetical protein